MIAFLPVSRYRVRYQVASGRPYSILERLVLEAIGGRQVSLEALEKVFRIHRRTLIECVVTLMGAGWVAIEAQSHELVVTEEGRRALGGSNELPNNMVVSERTDYLVGERLEAQLAKSTDVTFASRKELTQQSVI